MESPEILLFFRENIVENPEIYLFGFYVLFPNFSFLCVFVRLWLFCAFPYCLSCLSPPSLLENCAFFYAFLYKLYFSRHRIFKEYCI